MGIRTTLEINREDHDWRDRMATKVPLHKGFGNMHTIKDYPARTGGKSGFFLPYNKQLNYRFLLERNGLFEVLRSSVIILFIFVFINSLKTILLDDSFDRSD